MESNIGHSSYPVLHIINSLSANRAKSTLVDQPGINTRAVEDVLTAQNLHLISTLQLTEAHGTDRLILEIYFLSNFINLMDGWKHTWPCRSSPWSAWHSEIDAISWRLHPVDWAKSSANTRQKALTSSTIVTTTDQESTSANVRSNWKKDMGTSTIKWEWTMRGEANLHS